MLQLDGLENIQLRIWTRITARVDHSVSLVWPVSGQYFRKKTLQTAQEGEKTPHEPINVLFNFIGIFKARWNLDMQFLELYS